MKKYIGFFIGLLLMAGLTGCLNKTCPQHDEIYIDNYAQSLFFSFPSGSYWVYQDSLGNTDSTWVSFASDGIIGNGGCDENSTWELSSNVPNNFFSVTGRAGTPSTVGIGIGQGLGNQESCFNMYFLNGTIDSANNSYTSFAFLSNYNVNQFVFPNALKIISSQCTYINYIIVVPGIGIVEKSGLHGSSFKLIKYSIK